MSQRLIYVKVSAGAKTEKIEELPGSNGTSFKIRVSAPPEKGKANDRVLRLLSEHLNLPLTSLILTSGHTSREKVILVSE